MVRPDIWLTGPPLQHNSYFAIQAGKDTPSPARPPLRTVRASFPAYSSNPREAAYDRAAGSLSVERTYASLIVVVLRKHAEGADTVAGALSCSPSMNSNHDSASRDRAEVCSLSREAMLQPLSVPLQYGLRFFRLLLPARPTASLAVRLPRGQSFGLTTFPFPSHDRSRVRLFAGGRT